MMEAATMRALFVFAGWQGVRTVAAAGVLAVLFAGFVEIMPRAEPWVHRDLEAERAAAAAPSITDERFFHRQQKLLDEALARLERERPGVEDLYFVGVAPYASQDVFARELAAVRKLFDERFGTAGRSIALVNSPATLNDAPIASATDSISGRAHERRGPRVPPRFLGDPLPTGEGRDHGIRHHRIPRRSRAMQSSGADA
jgi:hypothetical protein